MKNNPGAPLILTVPTGSPSKGVLLPAGAIPGLVVGPLATVYVEPPSPLGRGNDATGQRGNAALPFATLDAALAVMLDGDTLELAPGSYAPPSAPIPAALKTGTIQTSGNPLSVVIDATGTGLPCLDFSVTPGNTRSSWQVFDGLGTSSARLVADVGQPAIKGDGTGAPAGTYFDQTIAIGCVLGGSLAFKYAASVIVASPTVVSPDTWDFGLCGQVVVLSVGLWPSGHSIDVTVDTNDPKQPPGGLGGIGPGIFFRSVVWPSGTLTLKKQASLGAAPGCVLPQITGSGLDVGPGPGFARTSISCNGGVAFGGIDFQTAGSQLPDDPAGNPRFELRGAEFFGSAAFAQVNDGNPSAVHIEGSIVHAFVIFGTGIDLHAQGTTGDQSPANYLAQSGSGVVRPPNGTAIAPVPIGALVTTIPLPWKLAAPVAAQYIAIPVSDNPTTIPLAVNNYTQTGFDLTVAVAAGSVGAILTFYG